MSIFLWCCVAIAVVNFIKDRDNFSRLKSSATFVIFVVNIICFVLTLGGHLFTRAFANNFSYTFGHIQIYRLLTSMFYHSSISHIVCNSITLLSVGAAVESLYGKRVMLEVYFTTGILGGAISSLIHMLLRHNVYSVGASGAICGLIGYLIGRMIKTKNKQFSFICSSILSILIIGVAGRNVDNIAHFSSLLVGITMSIIL